MYKIPVALIYMRLAIGIVLPVLSIVNIAGYAVIAAILIALGLLSDIFDGIIARKLGISSERLRRLDSAIDQVFWCLIALATYIQCPAFFKTHYIKLFILLGAEATAYAISFIKFRKEVATHAIASKLWVLTIFATLIQVIFTCDSDFIFQLCFWLGITTRVEIMAILLVLKTWVNDVPSFYHALQIKKGKPMKRNKLFNG